MHASDTSQGILIQKKIDHKINEDNVRTPLT